jgi:hypothetical protein
MSPMMVAARAERNLAQPGADRRLDRGLVVPQCRRRQVEALALLQPLTEELAERRAHTVLCAAGAGSSSS